MNTRAQESAIIHPCLRFPRHFGDRIGADGLEFDFRLRPGPATSRNAIALLRQLGAAPELVERAERTARALDRRTSKA